MQIVAVRPVAAKVVFVKQPFDSTTQTDLVGMFLNSNWPAHLLMPAAAHNRYRRARQPRCHDAYRP